MAEDEGSPVEGMSTPKKVAAGAAVGLATAAAVGVGKKLLGSNGDSDDDSGGSPQQSQGRRSSSSSRRSGSSSGAKARSGSSRRSSGGSGKTKEQLYAQAKRLGIEGRSRMTKAQLERAVARARG